MPRDKWKYGFIPPPLTKLLGLRDDAGAMIETPEPPSVVPATPRINLTEAAVVAKEYEDYKNIHGAGIPFFNTQGGVNPPVAYSVWANLNPVALDMVYHIKNMDVFLQAAPGAPANIVALQLQIFVCVDMAPVWMFNKRFATLQENWAEQTESPIDYYAGPNTLISVFGMFDYNGGVVGSSVSYGGVLRGELIPKGNINIGRGQAEAPTPVAGHWTHVFNRYTLW